MNVGIRFNNLVRQLLQPHKRQTNRLILLRSFVAPLQMLYNTFDIFRSDARMIVNVNSQVIVLEGYLRKKYNQPFKIKIVTYADGLLAIGFEEEGVAEMVAVGFEDEGPLAGIPFEGEIRQNWGDVDFIVYIPVGVDIKQVQADIEKYKRVSKTFRIIQN